MWIKMSKFIVSLTLLGYGAQTGEGGLVMHHTDPSFHGVVVALTIIIVVCGLIVVSNFFITLSR